MNKLIYIADDEADICSLLQLFLRNENYEVNTFSNGDALYAAYLKKVPDVIILDIMMPGTDGLSICNKIRKESSVPIILLTAKDSDTDQIAGFTMGSDDYITKPFLPTLLVMRVNAMLRRMEAKSNQGKQEDCRRGNLRLSYKGHSVYCDDTEIVFTEIEFTCFTYLFEHFNEAVSRDTLLDEVWGYSSTVETRVTDETIRRIRKKLASAQCNVTLQTKWGYGYKLTEGDTP